MEMNDFEKMTIEYELRNGKGKIVRKIRTQKNMTQYQLGELCCVKKAQISKMKMMLKI